VEFDNSFEVPLPPDKAWATLMDIQRIAPCMPGAQLTEMVDEKTFKGKVSVRLGPVALTFQGQASFEEIDNAAHNARVKAQGADAKGRGGAQAAVGFSLEPSAAGSKVLIHTDLQLSGSVAQYGRGAGMIQDLASQIIGQFAKNLAKQIEADQAATPAAASAAPSAPAAAGAPAAAAAPPPPPPPPPPAAPAQMGGMAFRVLWNQIVRSIKSLFGIKS
jgi:carbon monoxide dehydrogenase subunit G